MEVHLKDGRVLSQRVDRIDEGALRGVTMGEIQEKFRDCAAPVLSADAVRELEESLGDLENAPDVSHIVHLLRGDAAPGNP